MSQRRGQAALEYLFTYGWAFLSVLITIGVLAYFGVFDISNLRGSTCEFTPGTDCLDYTITRQFTGNPEVRVVLTNYFAADLEVTQVTARERRFDADPCVLLDGGTWNREADLNVSCPFNPDYFQQQENYEFTLFVTFRQPGQTYLHNITGLVRGNPN